MPDSHQPQIFAELTGKVVGAIIRGKRGSSHTGGVHCLLHDINQGCRRQIRHNSQPWVSAPCWPGSIHSTQATAMATRGCVGQRSFPLCGRRGHILVSSWDENETLYKPSLYPADRLPGRKRGLCRLPIQAAVHAFWS